MSGNFHTGSKVYFCGPPQNRAGEHYVDWGAEGVVLGDMDGGAYSVRFNNTVVNAVPIDMISCTKPIIPRGFRIGSEVQYHGEPQVLGETLRVGKGLKGVVAYGGTVSQSHLVKVHFDGNSDVIGVPAHCLRIIPRPLMRKKAVRPDVVALIPSPTLPTASALFKGIYKGTSTECGCEIAIDAGSWRVSDGEADGIIDFKSIKGISVGKNGREWVRGRVSPNGFFTLKGYMVSDVGFLRCSDYQLGLSVYGDSMTCCYDGGDIEVTLVRDEQDSFCDIVDCHASPNLTRFNVGEEVLWVEKHDADIASWEIGRVIGFGGVDCVVVEYPQGTWGFEPGQLASRRPMSMSDIEREAAEIGLPDGHLMLGMTLDGINQFATEIDFPTGYCRVQTLSACNENSWLEGEYGAALTGYDFVFAIRAWLKQHNKESYSIAEVCVERNVAGVGRANTFVSHVQSQQLGETLKHSVLAKGGYLWLDYTTLRQLQGDFKADHIAKVIGRIGNTFAIEDEDRQYLNRAFCIFEVAATPAHCLTMNYTTVRGELELIGQQIFPCLTFCDTHIRVAGTAGVTIPYSGGGGILSTDDLIRSLEDARRHTLVASRAANCRRKKDLDEVHAFICENGGFDAIDHQVSHALQVAKVQD